MTEYEKKQLELLEAQNKKLGEISSSLFITLFILITYFLRKLNYTVIYQEAKIGNHFAYCNSSRRPIPRSLGYSR